MMSRKPLDSNTFRREGSSELWSVIVDNAQWGVVKLHPQKPAYEQAEQTSSIPAEHEDPRVLKKWALLQWFEPHTFWPMTITTEQDLYDYRALTVWWRRVGFWLFSHVTFSTHNQAWENCSNRCLLDSQPRLIKSFRNWINRIAHFFLPQKYTICIVVLYFEISGLESSIAKYHALMGHFHIGSL